MSSRSSADLSSHPPGSIALHLDVLGGLAGDMFAAAMVDALPVLESGVRAALEAVRPPGGPRPVWYEAHASGLRARRFSLANAPGAAVASSGPGAYRVSASGLAPTSGGRARRGHRGPGVTHSASTNPATDRATGSSYPDLRRVIERAPLEVGTRRHALALLALLAEAEAHVHGVALEAVHFHELADWDSLLDVVAAASIAAQLEGAHWTCSSLPLGGGTVRTDHGMLPVPAPATARLLEGYCWHDDGVAGERITPTGAAILRHLVDPRDCGAGRQGGVLIGTGHGAGSRALPGLPNIVRVVVVERLPASTGRRAGETDRTVTAAFDDALAQGDFAARDRVATLEFDVDDMTGEEIAQAADQLRAQGGILDVSIGTRVGKKGRTVADFRVLAKPDAIAAVARACFTETTTLGVRVRDERRMVLTRSETIEEVGGVQVRVKIADRPGGAATAKAEHDDVKRERGLRERRSLRSAAARSALKRRPG